jgi:NAD+--asparagine ADP-ribosyltransferase
MSKDKKRYFQEYRDTHREKLRTYQREYQREYRAAHREEIRTADAERRAKKRLISQTVKFRERTGELV